MTPTLSPERKDKLEAAYNCKCGIKLSIPYRRASENIAPSYEEYRKVAEQLTEMVLQHQNRECAYMFNERVKARVGIKIEKHISLEINDYDQVVERPFYVYKHTSL